MKFAKRVELMFSPKNRKQVKWWMYQRWESFHSVYIYQNHGHFKYIEILSITPQKMLEKIWRAKVLNFLKANSFLDIWKKKKKNPRNQLDFAKLPVHSIYAIWGYTGLNGTSTDLFIALCVGANDVFLYQPRQRHPSAFSFFSFLSVG